MFPEKRKKILLWTFVLWKKKEKTKELVE